MDYILACSRCSYLFDHGLARGRVAIRPAPFFVESKAAAIQDLRFRIAGSGAEHVATVDVVITHIESARSIGDRDQAAESDRTALVCRPNAGTALAIVEARFRSRIAVRRIAAHRKPPLIVGNRRRRSNSVGSIGRRKTLR